MRAVLISVASMCCAAAPVFAGQLNPPSGPINPTGRFGPRIEINATNTPGDADSMFKITEPGSYYLGGNTLGEAGKHGIAITSDRVTIDLMGFELRGVAESRSGITVISGDFYDDLVVRNGVVADWGEDGVSLHQGFVGSRSLIERLLVSNNGDVGIEGTHELARIQDCHSEGNGQRGIVATNNASITSCSARGNGNSGIFVLRYSVVAGCIAESNGATGIYVAQGSVVVQCASHENLSRGFLILGDTIAFQNTASKNLTTGITASANTLILQNRCHGNGQAGILVTSSNNRIEANHLTDNPIGLDIDAAGNLILNNTCSANTSNWEFVADNLYGRIVDLTAVASPAVASDTAASVLISVDPWANFTY